MNFSNNFTVFWPSFVLVSSTTFIDFDSWFKVSRSVKSYVINIVLSYLSYEAVTFNYPLLSNRGNIYLLLSNLLASNKESLLGKSVLLGNGYLNTFV